MAEETTINVHPSTRNKIREIKGFERTYDELLSEWAEMFGSAEDSKLGT